MKVTKENIIDNAFGRYRVYDNYAMICCPYHDDDHPSMIIGDGGFKCLGCGQKGSLHKLLLKLSYGLGANISAKQLEYDITHPPWFSNAETFAHASYEFMRSTGQGTMFWKLRGLNSKHCRSFVLGYIYPWAIIPIRDKNYSIDGIVFRYDGTYRYVPRYHIPKGQRPTLFVPDPALLTWHKKIFITFGLIDALSLAAHQFPAITTSGSGTNSFDIKWLEDTYLNHEFIILPDRGEEVAGVALQRQIGLRATVHVLPYLDGMKDPNDYLQTNREDKLKEYLGALI